MNHSMEKWVAKVRAGLLNWLSFGFKNMNKCHKIEGDHAFLR